MNIFDSESIYGLLLPTLECAYTIRIALAENDIYGNVKVFLAPLQAPFQTNCMDSVYRAYDRSKKETNSGPWKEGYVIGNVAMGLEVTGSQGPNEKSTTMKVVLNPKVVVSPSIDFVFDKSTYCLAPVISV